MSNRVCMSVCIVYRLNSPKLKIIIIIKEEERRLEGRRQNRPGYYEFGCVNISFICYCVNVLSFEGNISLFTFGLSRDVFFLNLIFIAYVNAQAYKIQSQSCACDNYFSQRGNGANFICFPKTLNRLVFL